MHADELDVPVETVRSLVREQFPQWADLPVRAVDTAGTDHGIFRIGDELAARFPRRAADPERVRPRLEREAAASKEFADVSPVPSPRPMTIGEPGHGYPLPWCVQTWLTGRDAVEENPAGSLAFADELAELIRCLRRADTHGRVFAGDGRGGHLPDHDAWLEKCFANSDGLLDVPRLRSTWTELRELPRVDADVMCHGDLTPTNVLVDDGHLAGVLDTGGFAPADPALDLVSVWHLLDAAPRERVRDALDVHDVQWRRGMAWAFQQAMGLVWYYADSKPVMSAWGRQTLERITQATGG